MLQEQERLIYDIAQQLSQTQGLELVEIKIGRHNKDVSIQILVDKPQGKISLKDCSLLNRAIVEAIDKEGILSEDGYSLEVASPGLDRPLATYKDFLRNLNKEVHLWLSEQVAGKKEHRGIIKSVTQEVLMIVTTKEQQEITVPVSQIMKGLLVI